MRNWQLTGGDPLALRLAADARQFYTDYADDQIWELNIGEGQSPALALETRYGGRCGLMRLAPMWIVNERVIYEAADYASPPVVHVFGPGFVRLSARPTPHLAVQVETWAMTSHAIGGRFTLRNESDTALETGVDLFAQVMTEGKAGEIGLLTLEGGQHALHLKKVGNLNPVVMMHAVRASSQPSPKLAARVTIPPGEKTTLRWVHAARPDVRESLALAAHWLYQEDWGGHFLELQALQEAVPVIETGDTARDAAIAFSYRVALGSFVGPTPALPHPSIVGARIPARGFSPAGDGTDHYWQWAGQTIPEVYLTALAVAPAAPDLAEGLVRNALAVMQPDGFVDGRPGLAGQRSGLLAAPLLAALTWQVYQYTGNLAFVREAYPALGRFFGRWFALDVDRDGDGLPEWQAAAQAGFRNHPIFAPYLTYSQNVDIRMAESPGLAALLIREARSLIALGEALGQSAAIEGVQARLDGLLAHLSALWQPATGGYQYRDRDTHGSSVGGVIADGPGDQELLPSLELSPPARLVVRVRGGRDHRPGGLRVTLHGIGAEGDPVEEVLEDSAFDWYRSGGAATSARVYARIDRVTTEGLSRVYTVEVRSIDWTLQDVTLLLPLASGADAERTACLIATVTDPARYWRHYGVPLCPADSPVYDPANEKGCGGVWPLWNTLLAEGLLDAGRADLAASLLDRLLAARIGVLKAEKGFRDGYNPDALAGLGDRDTVTGIVPLHLLWRLMGFTIQSPQAVAIQGGYGLPWPVRVRLYGVTVERSAGGMQITFASGAVKRLRSPRPRVITDDSVEPTLAAAPRRLVARPAPGPAPRQAGHTMKDTDHA